MSQFNKLGNVRNIISNWNYNCSYYWGNITSNTRNKLDWSCNVHTHEKITWGHPKFISNPLCNRLGFVLNSKFYCTKYCIENCALGYSNIFTDNRWRNYKSNVQWAPTHAVEIAVNTGFVTLGLFGGVVPNNKLPTGYNTVHSDLISIHASPKLRNYEIYHHFYHHRSSEDKL